MPSQRGQQVIICIIGAVIIGVFLTLWYLPLRRESQAVTEAKAQRAMAIAQGAADAKQLPLAKEQLSKLQTSIGDYEAKIPDQRAHGVFLHRIDELMREHSLSDQVITPGSEIETEKFNCIPVKMRCRGRLAQITDFYRRLQNLDRLVRIERVTLTNDSTYSGDVTMETEAFVYYKSEVGQDKV